MVFTDVHLNRYFWRRSAFSVVAALRGTCFFANLCSYLASGRGAASSTACLQSFCFTPFTIRRAHCKKMAVDSTLNHESEFSYFVSFER